MLKPHLQALFDDYFSSHQHPTNRLTHKVAIPAHRPAHRRDAGLGPAGQRPGLPGGVLTLGLVAWPLATVWYLRADVKLGLIVSAGMALCFPLGRMIPVWAVVALAVVGWLVQLAGHAVWEKKSPSFFTNLVHALVRAPVLRRPPHRRLLPQVPAARRLRLAGLSHALRPEDARLDAPP